MNYDVVIVGAGVSGLMTAIELHKAGLKLCIVEKGNIGQESSWAGGGILSPLYPWRYPDAVNHLAQWSADHYPEYLKQLHHETGINPEYIKSGHLILDTNLDNETTKKWADKFSVTTETITLAELKQIEPGLSTDFQTALYAPDIGQVRNPRLLKALAKQAKQLEIEIFENTPFTELNQRNGKVTGLTCNSDVFSSEQVLITAGAWSGQLNLGDSVAPHIEPIKGQMIQFDTDPGMIRSVTLFDDHYVVPRRDGRVLAGSTIEHTQFDKSINDETGESLRLRTLELFPALEAAKVVNHWAGLRPGNLRHTPYIAQHPEIEGLFFNTGHYRNGIILGLASARLASDLILKQQPILPATDYQF